MKLQIRDMPDDVHKDLKRIALEADTSLNAVVIKALSAYVAKNKGKS